MTDFVKVINIQEDAAELSKGCVVATKDIAVVCINMGKRLFVLNN